MTNRLDRCTARVDRLLGASFIAIFFRDRYQLIRQGVSTLLLDCQSGLETTRGLPVRACVVRSGTALVACAECRAQPRFLEAILCSATAAAVHRYLLIGARLLSL